MKKMNVLVNCNLSYSCQSVLFEEW